MCNAWRLLQSCEKQRSVQQQKSLYATRNVIFVRLLLSARIWFGCSFLEKARNKENKYPRKPPLRCCFCVLAQEPVRSLPQPSHVWYFISIGNAVASHYHKSWGSWQVSSSIFCFPQPVNSMCAWHNVLARCFFQVDMLCSMHPRAAMNCSLWIHLF